MLITPAHTRPRHGVFILLAIVAVAFLARVLALWVTRPEFMGWFNHAPWYWVQTRGLLETGQLPFADLPLLFHLYATLAQLLQALGLGQDPAIVHASRFVMCLVPALIAWPCWRIMQGIRGVEPLTWPYWALVAAAAFLPLTFSHMPELLQKNMLGLLFLAGMMHASYRALEQPRWSWAAAGWFALIALTHLGTLLAAGLWIVALSVVLLSERPAPGRWIIALAAAAGVVLAGWLGLSQFDPGALARISDYLASTLGNSLAALMLGDTGPAARAGALAGIVLPLGALALGLKSWQAAHARLTRANQVFWMACLWFAWFLAAPLIDLEILPRLLLFLPLPLLFITAFHLRYGNWPRLTRVLVSMAGLGLVLLVVGETQQLVRGLPGKAATHDELLALADRFGLGDTDFVIAPYAVAPALNWFLGTRAGLITATSVDDFERFDRVFVLNTGTEQQPDWEGAVVVDSDAVRYRLMRQAVPVPADAIRDPQFERFDLYQLPSWPGRWTFDETGRWSGVAPATGAP